MGSAGYGNHEEAVAERPSEEAASAKLGAGSTDRPGLDLGGAGDLSSPQGQMAGSRSVPDPAGTGPHSGNKDSGSPTLSDDDRRDQSTPGSGALPSDRPQGGEVDPGAG
ncbi:hypothetical protein [Enterovirga aerilata]|uniref:Uncharacterized protein n=1 Tax=Enterovirga aerilata TaxID=2730920 RepID=A0A849I129_9HYPH|nr:hypothetical protein [Enterovirga sp. DB1703]NNM71264.1 hypothetical protein [Enterovirga sp. DB1703]